MKSSRLFLCVVFLCAFLPFGAGADEPVLNQTPAPAATQPATTSSTDFGSCAPMSVDACYTVSIGKDQATDPQFGCVEGYRYDQVTKKSKWFRTKSPECDEYFKKKDKKKAEKKKQQASTQPANPSNPPVTNPTPTKDTLTIEITREEWEALLATVRGLTPGDPNYTTVITEIRNRLGLFESGLAVEATSRDKEIRELQVVVNSIDAQIKDLQKQIDDEKAARIAADKKLADEDAKLWDANAKLWKAFNAFLVDGDATLGHVLAGEYFGGFLFAGGQPAKKSDFMGLSLRVALNERVGIHGGVAADLNLLRRVPTEGGATALQLGLYYPDVTWNVGLDFVYNSKIVVTVDGRVVHQGLYSVGGLTVESLNPLGCAGIEASVFKRWPTSALTFSGCGGLQIDKDSPLPEFGLHVGMKHGLWVKGK